MKWPLSLAMGRNMKVVPLVVQGPHVTLWCPLPDLGGLSWSIAHHSHWLQDESKLPALCLAPSICVGAPRVWREELQEVCTRRLRPRFISSIKAPAAWTHAASCPSEG